MATTGTAREPPGCLSFTIFTAPPAGSRRARWWMKLADGCLAMIGTLTDTVFMRPGIPVALDGLDKMFGDLEAALRPNDCPGIKRLLLA